MATLIEPPWGPAREALWRCHLASWRLAPKYDLVDDRRCVQDLRALVAACAFLSDDRVRGALAQLDELGSKLTRVLPSDFQPEFILQWCHEALLDAMSAAGFSQDDRARVAPSPHEEWVRSNELRDAREAGEAAGKGDGEETNNNPQPKEL